MDGCSNTTDFFIKFIRDDLSHRQKARLTSLIFWQYCDYKIVVEFEFSDPAENILMEHQSIDHVRPVSGWKEGPKSAVCSAREYGQSFLNMKSSVEKRYFKNITRRAYVCLMHDCD